MIASPSKGMSPLLLEYHATEPISPYLDEVFPARDAYSHSDSVGSLPSVQVQNACASSHVTFTIGCSKSFHPGLKRWSNHFGSGGIFLPASSIKCLYALTVTSVCPIQKPFEITTSRAGLSMGSHCKSPAEQPIVKLPLGTHTYCWKWCNLTLISPACRD